MAETVSASVDYARIKLSVIQLLENATMVARVALHLNFATKVSYVVVFFPLFICSLLRKLP